MSDVFEKCRSWKDYRIAKATGLYPYFRAIEESYELTILQPPIPKTIRFAEAPAIGRSILGTSKTHKGAEAYRQVAASLLNGHGG